MPAQPTTWASRKLCAPMLAHLRNPRTDRYALLLLLIMLTIVSIADRSRNVGPCGTCC